MSKEKIILEVGMLAICTCIHQHQFQTEVEAVIAGHGVPLADACPDCGTDEIWIVEVDDQCHVS